MKTNHKCIIGDSRKMDDVKDSSVHLVVTSPPYWQLKDYGTEDQIGFNDSYENYINNLNLVWKECYRVLNPGCRMLINIGDQFARAVYYGRYKVIPIRTEIIKYCESIGFDYLGAIIWQKRTTMNTTGGATVMGSYPFPRNGIVEIDYEFILIFKKPGKTPPVDKTIKEQSKISKEKWKEYFSGHWYFNGARQDNHIAMFPVELPKRAIEMFTFIGETVLDPFLGSGTTSLAAILSNRNSIGYEINKDFLSTIKEKLEINKNALFLDFEVKEQNLNNINWDNEIKKSKYIFHDPVKFDKKIDPNKLKFGSKISVEDNKNGIKRENYYTVKEIISPNLIKLSNDLTIRMIGVKPNDNKSKEAINFLNNKILKRQIYLKYDEIKYDNNNQLLAYVYMKNKTFVNAHILKHGFGELDSEIPFKYINKFKNLQSENASYEKTM
ncbi:DNA methylase N-4 [candidate division KSB1 bacterium 4572_119]|nr:MAG: DNA methylase N-4 [candidate division KSB1 bacterium 4572_119]